jgi:hypothetical protein
MAKSPKGAPEGTDVTQVTRRDLVNIVVKSDDDRPYHIHLKVDGKLIARLKSEGDIDGFLNRLSETVFQ